MNHQQAASAITPEELCGWTRNRVAYYLECAPTEIDVDRSLAGYGFDSVFALSLCGEIEDEYGLEVDPTLAWDFPTVRGIADRLASDLC
jgi:acyl carrier protein